MMSSLHRFPYPGDTEAEAQEEPTEGRAKEEEKEHLEVMERQDCRITNWITHSLCLPQAPPLIARVSPVLTVQRRYPNFGAA
jgi:hypothetical protein